MTGACVVALLLLLAGCRASGSTEARVSETPCGLVSPAAIESALPGTSVTSRVFEHEESGDGTWCLFTVDGYRVEIQAQPGSRVTFDRRREAAAREGAIFSDLPGLGEAAYRHSAGIPGVVVLSDGRLLVAQVLDRELAPATAETILRLALQP